MRIVLVLSMLGCVGMCDVSAANLLCNADMSVDDGAGVPLGWNINIYGKGPREGVSVVSRTVPDGPEGRPAKVFEAVFPVEKTFLRQRYFRLVPGEVYKMGVWVRTRSLPKASIALTVWDSGWKRELWSKKFPRDTAGKWHKVEWQGKMCGLARDGFSFAVSGTTGTSPDAKAEMTGLYLEPVSEAAIADSKPADRSRFKAVPNRIVPIDPKLDEVSPSDASMTFYYPRTVPCGISNVYLRASVDGAGGERVRFDDKRRARVSFGRISPGRHRMSVLVEDAQGIMLASNAYGITAREFPKDGPPGTVLNNFVTRLHAGRLSDGTVRFFCPRDTWVWISFDDASGNPVGRLDGTGDPVIGRRQDERRTETQRWLTAGWHELHVEGAVDGRLRIHAVKRLVTDPWNLGRRKTDIAGYVYPRGYYRRYFFGGFNTVNPRKWDQGVRMPDEEKAFYAERGIAVVPQLAIIPEDSVRLDSDRLFRLIDGSVAMKEGTGIELDESGIYVARPFHSGYAEALWRMVDTRPDIRIDADWCDSDKKLFDDPVVQASEISAIVNTGRGTGMMYPEVYCAPQTNIIVSRERSIGHYSRFVRSVLDMVPAARDSIFYFFATYIDLGGWSDYPTPQTDIKVHYDGFIRALAMEKDFSGAVGGISVCGTRSCEEETIRWLARCLRHYCVEGRTESLSDVYGFRHLPGIVRNCDFDDALSGWEVEPAVDGGVRPGRLDGYGKRIQRRQKVSDGTGDSVAVFTRSAKGPNRLAQKLTGLESGRYYLLLYCTADYDDVVNRDGRMIDESFSSDLEGADTIGELSFFRRKQTRPKDGTKPVRLLIERKVFRARGETARLVFSDWPSGGGSVVAGSRRVLNYIVFRPYYNEGEEDVEFLRAAFGKEGKTEK